MKDNICAIYWKTQNLTENAQKGYKERYTMFMLRWANGSYQFSVNWPS